MKNLKVVMATALGEEYYHSQADQVSTDILFAIHIYTVISVVLYCGLVLIPVHSIMFKKVMLSLDSVCCFQVALHHLVCQCPTWITMVLNYAPLGCDRTVFI